MVLCSMGIAYGSHSMAYNYSLLNVSVFVGIIYIYIYIHIYMAQKDVLLIILSVLSIFRVPFL